MEISPGVMIMWQIAASESASAKQPFIEKEHLFIGLCKVCNLLHQEAIKEEEELKVELEMFEGIFDELSVNRKRLYRRLREIVGKGDYEHKEKEIHRSEECKRSFARAEEIAKEYKYPALQGIHLCLSIIEEPGENISKVISEFGLEIELMREAIINRLTKKPVSRGRQQQATPLLDKYGRDLTQLAEKKELAPLIGRRDELLQLIRTLTRKTKNNPLLIGEAGVGKTAIVEGLVTRIARKNLTPALQDKRIIELNMSDVVAGTKYRGEFEERLTGIINEAKSHPEIILFIDEVHTVVSAGAAQGALDAANILKPALARGELHIIGATTLSEYRKYIEKDAALERRFQPIMVNEPTPEETLAILKGVQKGYEEHHQVHISPSAISAAVKLSVRYILDRHLPDKALDVLDEACSRVKITSPSFHGKKGKMPSVGEVTDEIVAQVVSKWIGSPIRLTAEDQERFIRMEEILKERIIGQDEAVDKVCQAIKRAKAGLKDTKHPIAVFLFLGPTGVGKTELAKVLAKFFDLCNQKIMAKAR